MVYSCRAGLARVAGVPCALFLPQLSSLLQALFCILMHPYPYTLSASLSSVPFSPSSSISHLQEGSSLFPPSLHGARDLFKTKTHFWNPGLEPTEGFLIAFRVKSPPPHFALLPVLAPVCLPNPISFHAPCPCILCSGHFDLFISIP